jgi:hypothetical protein
MRQVLVIIGLLLAGCGSQDVVERRRQNAPESAPTSPSDLVCSSTDTGDHLECTNGTVLTLPPSSPVPGTCNACRTHVADGLASVDCPNGLQFSFPIIKGDKGDKGDQGEKGPAGAPGAKGDPGPSGTVCATYRDGSDQVHLRCGNTDEVISDSCGSMGCWSFGARGNVYSIPSSTTLLPDLGVLTPQESVTVAQLDVFNRNWSLGYPGLPTRTEWFAVRYTGYILLPHTCQLRLTSDDGARLYLDDMLTINNDGLHAPAAVTTPVTAIAGWHALRLDYFQGPRTQMALALEISIDGGITWRLVAEEELKFRN